MTSRDLIGRPLRLLTINEIEVTVLVEDTGQRVGMKRADWDAFAEAVELRRLPRGEA